MYLDEYPQPGLITFLSVQRLLDLQSISDDYWESVKTPIFAQTGAASFTFQPIWYCPHLKPQCEQDKSEDYGNWNIPFEDFRMQF